ncbi:hypothetical protein B0T26DRAFT_755488 [Lasiosphaeria miniovina]|uniref:Uncharacterized protein n=1 Tax=Lasiosphaeria miniovina TaxID=1954250 RepID=A0AA39ZYR9_9PEZI|nr:uncharacterized protein B0T26DRAFT_755488 [Lasiosphaeria miniovina]KAK0705924.1 hypothetical protein B0T26DRAFT_755488 [Lasiosphaeria miniovina]
MSRRRVIVLSKPVELRDDKERQRKADEDDEFLADDNFDSKRKWIRTDLAEMFNLRRESELSFEKAETTAEDLLMLLDTLWTLAEDASDSDRVR